jgi:hypothetical protein
MPLLPTESGLPPLTANVAVAALPLPVNVADPRTVLPSWNVTVPAGVPLPPAVTVAVKVVDPAAQILPGLAVSAVVVGVTEF